MRSRWSMRSGSALWLVALTAAGCGSVPVTSESYYRLASPEVRCVGAVRAEGLQVEGFELAAALSSDRLLVARSPVQLHAHEFHRWINPLERLVQDAVRTGLRRAEAFAEVRGPTDVPGDGWILTGRVLDFHQVPLGAGWGGLVRLEMRLRRSRDQRVVLRDEFAATVAMAGAEPAAAVSALSRAMAEVLTAFLRRCAEHGVLETPAAPPAGSPSDSRPGAPADSRLGSRRESKPGATATLPSGLPTPPKR